MKKTILFGILILTLLTLLVSGCGQEETITGNSIFTGVIKTTDTRIDYPQKEWVCSWEIKICDDDDYDCLSPEDDPYEGIYCTSYGDCPWACNERCIVDGYDGGESLGNDFRHAFNYVLCTCNCFNR